MSVTSQRENLDEMVVDVAILTILPQEFKAVYDRLTDPRPAPASDSAANLYAWKLAKIPSPGHIESYSIVLGMTVRPGTNRSAAATMDAITHWNPRYILYVGIAGGFKDDGLEKGDVVIADVIHGYEYGKLDKGKYFPRQDYTYRTDQALLSAATAFAAVHPNWLDEITAPRPEPGATKSLVGRIASGDKVVDDPTTDFFASVRKALPKLHAVEMEGAGVATAIELAQSSGKNVGFLMIRGISDMPRVRTETEDRGTDERDSWKVYAADAAATFAVSFIANGLPVPPRKPTQTEKPATPSNLAKEAIINSRPNQGTVVGRFMADLSNQVRSKAPDLSKGGEPDDLLVEAIDASTQLVIDLAQIAQAIAEYDSRDAAFAIYEGFAGILKGFWGRHTGFCQFIGNEFFVSFISFLVAEGRWETIAALLDRKIYGNCSGYS